MIGTDLQLLLHRRRVWLCWALLCALPALVAVLLAATGLAPPPGRGGAFLSAVVTNGQLFPAAALALVLPVFLPITVAIVVGDAVAVVLLAVLFVPVTGYLVGVALIGFGPDAELGGAGGASRRTARRRRDPILWPAVREGAAVQAGYVLVAFGAAWANLATKDITS